MRDHRLVFLSKRRKEVAWGMIGSANAIVACLIVGSPAPAMTKLIACGVVVGAMASLVAVGAVLIDWWMTRRDW
jgi:hypothetical protein